MQDRALPTWTWIAAFPLLLGGGWLAVALGTPHQLSWFMSAPLAIVLALWWGPERVLPPLFLGGTLQAMRSHGLAPETFLCALPETVAVAASWYLFARFANGDRQLTSARDVLRFAGLGMAAPAALLMLGRYLVGLGGPSEALPEAFIVTVFLIGCFMVAFPALVLATPAMVERGWAVGGLRRKRERILGPGEPTPAEKYAAVVVPLLLAAVPLLVPDRFVPFSGAVIFLGAALHFGFVMAALSGAWLLAAIVIAAVTGYGDAELPWAGSTEALEMWLELLLPLATGLYAGRYISDFRYEMERRSNLEWELGRAQATMLAAIEQSPAGIIIADAPDGMIRLANAAAVGMRGRVSEPLIDIPIERYRQSWQFHRPDGRPWSDEDLPLTRAIREGVSTNGVDLVIRNAEGEDRWIIANASPIRGLVGGIVGAIAVFTDVTERRRAEEDLRRSERRYRALVNASSQGFWLVDENGLTVDVNAALCRMLQVSRETLIGRSPADFAEAASADVIREQLKLRRLIDNCTYEVTALATNGTRIELRIDATAVRGIGRAFEGSFAFVTDITERKQAERALRASEARFRAFMDNSPAAMYVGDISGQPIYVNDRFKEWYGSGRHPLGMRGGLDDVIRRKRTIRREMRVPSRQGGHRDVAVFEFPIADNDGELLAVGGINLDVTDIRQTAEALRYRVAFEGLVARLSARFINLPPERLRGELENALKDVGKITRSDAATLFTVDASLSRFTPLARWQDEQHPCGGAEAIPAADAENWLGTLSAGEVYAVPRSPEAGESAAPFADVRWMIDVPMMRGGVLSGVLRMASAQEDRTWSETDVSLLKVLAETLGNTLDRQVMEEALRRAQKMEAVGQIAGGIAHDFNNLLGAIMGFSTFIVEDLDPSSSAFSFAQRIQKACERAKYMIQRLLAFSRRSDSERQPVGVADILEESAELLAGTVPTTIRLETVIDAPDAVVFADPVQLTQVFMNLCVNARDAIEDEPGEIRIHVRELTRERNGERWWEAGLQDWQGAAEAVLGTPPEGLPCIAIDVSDTGRGMSQDILDQIFEPFFTTKSAHRGTGLGLTVVQGIVTSHGGSAIVRSMPGRGTCFRVLMPATDARPAVQEAAVAAEISTRTGRILVVDDDVDFADVVSITLERAGMEVGVVNDPEMALDVFREDPAAWDVVMSDYAMPAMTGVELIRRIKEARDAVPCILCTAHAGNRFTPESVRELGIAVLLEKPVEPPGIVAAVRRCLGTEDG